MSWTPATKQKNTTPSWQDSGAIGTAVSASTVPGSTNATCKTALLIWYIIEFSKNRLHIFSIESCYFCNKNNGNPSTQFPNYGKSGRTKFPANANKKFLKALGFP
jgi:hypothetical protein